jgi:hypothetical protein
VTPSGNAPAIVLGLEAIAGRLGISLRKLKYLLDRPAGERPPVRIGHRGYYAVDSRLQDWVDAQDMDAGVHRELKRMGRVEASQRAAEGPGRAA